MQDFISQIKSQNPDLKRAEILGIFYILYSKDNLSNNELVRMTGIPKPVLKTFKTSAAAYLKKTDDEEITLNEDGMEALSQIELRPYRWSLLDYDLVQEEDKIFKTRVKYDIEPKRDLDQFFATSKSTVEKAKIIIDKGLVEEKDIAFIGDDDLVTLALGSMAPTYNKIKLFEIDKRLIDTISEVATSHTFPNITSQIYDVRKELPKNELHKYDVVLIDPPYTPSGARLFIHRAVELLRSKNNFEGSYIIFNYGVGLRNPKEEVKIQELISSYGLVIEDKLSKYTRYHGAETVGSASSLYVLKATLQTTTEGKILPEVIYTFEKTEENEFPYTDHYVFKLQKISSDLLSSKTKLQKILGDFCNDHKLSVVDSKVTKFKKQGFSFTYILSSSNMVIHTWPEKSSLHIDLITCSPIHNKEKMAENLSAVFRTKSIEVLKIE